VKGSDCAERNLSALLFTSLAAGGNPKSNITLSSLQRAAAMVGRRVMIELV
jgi:hypothetical protein